MSLLPSKFQPEALPSLGALVREVIAPKPSDPYASFYTNTSVELPDGTRGFIAEKDCKQIKGAAQAPAKPGPKAASPGAPPSPKFKVGDRVRNRAFGDGVVLQITPDSTRPIFKCEFVASAAVSHFYADSLELIPSSPAQDIEGWIEWKGGKCPIPHVGRKKWEMRHRDGDTFFGDTPTNGYDDQWEHTNKAPDCHIVAYRVLP